MLGSVRFRKLSWSVVW